MVPVEALAISAACSPGKNIGITVKSDLCGCAVQVTPLHFRQIQMICLITQMLSLENAHLQKAFQSLGQLNCPF